MHHQTFLIKILTCLWPAFSKIQFTIDIIFDQRDVMFRDNIDQFLFIFIRHTTTQRIIKIGYYYTGFDRVIFNDFLQAIKLNTIDGTRCHLHHFQSEGFNRLVNAKIGRTFNGNGITGICYRFQTNGDCFQTSSRNDHFFRLHLSTPVKCKPCNLFSQFNISLCMFIINTMIFTISQCVY